MLKVEKHLAVRNVKKNELEGRKTAKKLRYIFKGDINAIKDYFVQKYMAGHFQGVNKILTIYDEYKDYFSVLTPLNFATIPEPATIKKINAKIANALA